jgi:hypothetical protein
MALCAYCVENKRTEREHVFARSWYPKLPPNVLTVPSCRRCNGNYGRLEERLFLPLVMAMPPGPLTNPLMKRALRAADSAAGVGLRDVSHREARYRSFMRRVSILGDLEPANAAWTPAGRISGDVTTPAGLLVRGTPTVELKPAEVDAIAIKFLKGCYYDITGAPLPANIRCGAQGFTRDPRDLIEQVKNLPGYQTRGAIPFETGFLIDGPTSLFIFVLWDFHCLAAWSNISPEQIEARRRGRVSV